MNDHDPGNDNRKRGKAKPRHRGELNFQAIRLWAKVARPGVCLEDDYPDRVLTQVRIKKYTDEEEDVGRNTLHKIYLPTI